MRNLWAVLLLSLLPLAAPAAEAQDSAETLPKLISHADAIYPAIAQTAHVMGDVVVKITTDGQSVVDAQAESGPPLLQRASVDNAKTWKFALHTPRTFHVTYRYDLGSSQGTAATSFPSSTAIVEIVAAPQQISVYWSWVPLGKWKAELKSPHGRFSKTLEFLWSGPNGEWLDVKTSGTADDNGEDRAEDDEFSRKDGDFLIFSMKLAQANGKLLRTYFTGKVSGEKIVGTFVDESGVRGTWTAIRIPGSEKE
jgi:hypothetical protein